MNEILLFLKEAISNCKLAMSFVYFYDFYSTVRSRDCVLLFVEQNNVLPICDRALVAVGIHRTLREGNPAKAMMYKQKWSAVNAAARSSQHMLFQPLRHTCFHPLYSNRYIRSRK